MEAFDDTDSSITVTPRQLERDRMQEILDDMAHVNGRVDETRVQEYVKRLR